MNNGKICVPVCAETADEMIAQIKRAEEFADVIEVRFDCIDGDELNRAREKGRSKRTVIVTFRSREQGGQSSATTAERAEFWRTVNKKVAAVDAEEDIFDQVRVAGKRILSFHDFTGVPADLSAHAARLLASEADTVKIAASVADASDAIAVWELIDAAKAARKWIIPIAMGEAGKWTRILGLAHGAYLTYGSLEPGKETADGQITAKDLIEIYRVKELDQATKVFGIIGDPVSSSLSPYMQNPAFVAGKINAVFIPLLVKDLDAFIRRMVLPETREVELNFAGFSVTMPHKQAIMKHLHDVDETAKKIGAVNTVTIDGDKLIGHNTDAHGFITPLKEKIGDLKNANVSVGGAGGAARACVYALKNEGANVTVYARDQKKAEMFAEEFGVETGVSHRSFQPGAIDILVNATPLGMKGGETEATIAAAQQLKGVKLVYDLVYNPIETRLLREARSAGVDTIGGLEMLVAQGAQQFEIWTGHTAPVELMRDTVLKRINDGG